MDNSAELLVDPGDPAAPDETQQRLNAFPLMRYMGSKSRLLPWIREVLRTIEFESVLDAFSGSGAVSYLFKAMGKRVLANDFLHFSHILTKAIIENDFERIAPEHLDILLGEDPSAPDFIRSTFNGIFFSTEDLQFLDLVSHNIKKLDNRYLRALALSALIRSSVKKQPRGVFTISGDISRYDDGRRDMRLSLRAHFREQVDYYNSAVFSNGNKHLSFNSDIFEFDDRFYRPDLVYLDPPYVPKSDDNCYVKRYHFLEGLSKYWADEEILYDTKVKKIKKKYTPFSYRRTADEAFHRLFRKFADSKIVLSYSSNGYPTLDELESMMRLYKKRVDVYRRPHRYHFGTHGAVKRAMVDEYLIVGT
ncbi:MAG: DNA adenine methylase [Alkalispirochaeta sp.]